MAKRILMNAFSAKVGGGITYVRNLLERMPQGEFSLFIYAPDDMKLPQDKRITRVTTTWPTHNPFLRSLWERFLLPGVLKRLSIELLFCPGGVHNTSPSKDFKVVTMFRNMLPFDPQIMASSVSKIQQLRGRLLKKVMLKSMSQADVVIFISNFARKVIESQITVNAAHTIPHGIAKLFYRTDLKMQRPPLAFNQKYILYVSRFEFYKRHLEVVKAYQLMPAQIRAEYKLLLVGETNLPYGEQVTQYVKEKNLSQVVILGYYPYADLPALYQNASLFVFASTCENCPNILLEALGSGAPILCSNYEPMPEFGGNAVTYMNPDNPEDIAAKILQCLNAEVKSEEMQAQAKKFSWDVTAEKTWKLLLDL